MSNATFIIAKTSKNQYPVSAPKPSIGGALARTSSRGFAPVPGGRHTAKDARLTLWRVDRARARDGGLASDCDGASDVAVMGVMFLDDAAL